MALTGQRTEEGGLLEKQKRKAEVFGHSAFGDIEPRLNRIRGYKYLPELQRAIQMELGIK